MSCPKCEPRARSRRWLWWVGLALLVLAAAWLDRSSRQARAPGQGSARDRSAAVR
jgi:hypothetical protein